MEQIGNILSKFLYELGIDRPVMKYRALTMWPEIVGERISNVTEAKRLTDGKMFVKVQNDSWRNELTFYKQEIIQKINKEIGLKIVKDIILI